MNSVIPFRVAREAPKAERSAMETLIFTVEQMGQWKVPAFQRPISINQKVLALAEDIKRDGGAIQGVITLGTIKGSDFTYIVDGQHRLEAFRISGLPEFIGDVRHIKFDSMAEMADEFVRLNTALVRMRPDDILRGLESSVKSLQRIRKECVFVGYDQIRRGTTSPIVGMSALLRCWRGSAKETPGTGGALSTPAMIAQALGDEETDDLIVFLKIAEAAWGRDAEYARLWGSLNLTLCMWLWRRLVRGHDRTSVKRHLSLNFKQFRNCLMGLSADGTYLEFLQGRQINDRDRNPAYQRIKRIWGARLSSEFRGRIQFPAAAWVS